MLHYPSEFMHNTPASSIIYLATVVIVVVQSAVDRSSTIFVEDLKVTRGEKCRSDVDSTLQPALYGARDISGRLAL